MGLLLQRIMVGGGMVLQGMVYVPKNGIQEPGRV